MYIYMSHPHFGISARIYNLLDSNKSQTIMSNETGEGKGIFKIHYYSLVYHVPGVSDIKYHRYVEPRSSPARQI